MENMSCSNIESQSQALHRRWSCERCRQRKKKCDSVRPSCSLCTKLNADCIYLGVAKNKKLNKEPTTAQTTESTQEPSVQLAGDSSSPPSSSESVDHSKLLSLLGVAKDDNGTIEFAKAQLVIDTVFKYRALQQDERTSRSQFIKNFEFLNSYLNINTTIAYPASPTPPTDTSTQLATPDSLQKLENSMNSTSFYSDSFIIEDTLLPPTPPPPLANILSDEFLEAHAKITCCSIIHRSSVEMNFDSLNPLLRTVLYALKLEHTKIQLSDNSWYDSARTLVYCAIERPTIQCLQGLLLLHSCACALGKIAATHRFAHMSSQMAILMNLNIDPDDLEIQNGVQYSWAEKEALRRCWWTCFLLEKVLYMGFEKPGMLPKYNNVKPICNEKIWNSMADVPIGPQTFDNPFNDMIEFFRLVGESEWTDRYEVVRFDDSKLVKLISDAQLWNRNLPFSSQLPVKETEYSSGRQSAEAPWCVFYMHLWYHNLMSTIHLPLVLENVYSKSHPNAFGRVHEGNAIALASMLCPTSPHFRPRNAVLPGANGLLSSWSATAKSQVESSYALVKNSVEVIGRMCQHISESYIGQTFTMTYPLFQISKAFIVLAIDSKQDGGYPDVQFHQQCVQWLESIEVVIDRMSGNKSSADEMGKLIRLLLSWIRGSMALWELASEFRNVIKSFQSTDGPSASEQEFWVSNMEEYLYLVLSSLPEEEEASVRSGLGQASGIAIVSDGSPQFLSGGILDELLNLDWMEALGLSNVQ